MGPPLKMISVPPTVNRKTEKRNNHIWSEIGRITHTSRYQVDMSPTHPGPRSCLPASAYSLHCCNQFNTIQKRENVIHQGRRQTTKRDMPWNSNRDCIDDNSTTL